MVHLRKLMYLQHIWVSVATSICSVVSDWRRNFSFPVSYSGGSTQKKIQHPGDNVQVQLQVERKIKLNVLKKENR